MKDKKEMTAQIAERLLYEGSEHAMCTNPLDDYFAMAGHRPHLGRPRPLFGEVMSGDGKL
jgi:hypothetical protein